MGEPGKLTRYPAPEPHPGVTVTATEYMVSALPPDHPDAYTWSVWVQQREWGIYCVRESPTGHSCVLDNSGEWVWEPSPSSRTDEFIAATRFPLEVALEMAKRAAPERVVCGMTAADVLAKGGFHK